MFKISNSFKKNLAQVLCLTIALTPVVGYAAESGRAANLKSHGKVNYTNGTSDVVIDSSDLVTLANEIDTLEENAKLGQVQALQSLPDVAVKNSLSSVTADTISGVTFDQINSAIRTSQSIDTTESVYKLPNGSVTEDSTAEGVEEVQISGATADNLSAGTAAWVDGQYIVGNGADNNSYYTHGKDATQLYTLICNRDNTDPGILPDTVLVPYDCSVTCKLYACNNVQRQVHIVVFTTNEMSGFITKEPIYSRTFTASELSKGIAPSPASSDSYAATEEITFTASKGDYIRFGMTCDENGNKLSGFSGYPYGLWIISIGSSYNEDDWDGDHMIGIN